MTDEKGHSVEASIEAVLGSSATATAAASPPKPVLHPSLRELNRARYEAEREVNSELGMGDSTVDAMCLQFNQLEVDHIARGSALIDEGGDDDENEEAYEDLTGEEEADQKDAEQAAAKRAAILSVLDVDAPPVAKRARTEVDTKTDKKSMPSLAVATPSKKPTTARGAKKKGANEAPMIDFDTPKAAELTQAEIDHINRNCSPPCIHNLVVSLRFNRRFDVRELAWILPGRHRQASASVTLHVHEPRFTALIFNSGQAIITGTKKSAEYELAAITLARYLSHRLNCIVTYSDMRCQNLMATVYLGYTVNIDLFQRMNVQHTTGREAFRAVKMLVDEGVVLLFADGVFVICGPKSETSAWAIRKSVIQKLARYRHLDMTRAQIEAARRKNNEKLRAERQLARLTKLIEASQTKFATTKAKKYSMITDAELKALLMLSDIQIGYCYPSDGPDTECKHHVWYCCGEDSRVIARGKLAWSKIVRLFVQNKFVPPVHKANLVAIGCPNDKKRPKQPVPMVPMPANWKPTDHERLLLENADFYEQQAHIKALEQTLKNN